MTRCASSIRGEDSAGRTRPGCPNTAIASCPTRGKRSCSPCAIYGAWNMQGVVAGPGNLGPVFMLHGGHGMNYLLTCDDGLFIGTLFKPQSAGCRFGTTFPKPRPGMLLENYTLNDECFCGSIARAEASAGGFQRGKYYLLGLGRRAVVELTGLDTVERLSGGKVLLGASAVENTRRQQIEAVTRKSATQFKEATTWNVALVAGI